MMPWVVKTAAASPTKFPKCKVRQRSLHVRLPAEVSELKDNAVTSDNVVMIAVNSIKDYSHSDSLPVLKGFQANFCGLCADLACSPSVMTFQSDEAARTISVNRAD